MYTCTEIEENNEKETEKGEIFCEGKLFLAEAKIQDSNNERECPKLYLVLKNLCDSTIYLVLWDLVDANVITKHR